MLTFSGTCILCVLLPHPSSSLIVASHWEAGDAHSTWHQKYAPKGSQAHSTDPIAAQEEPVIHVDKTNALLFSSSTLGDPLSPPILAILGLPL